jgi:hypothetical protein
VKIISKLEPSTHLKVLPILFAQKIVRAAQKNVHPSPHVILNHNDISRLVSGTLVAL